MGDFRDTPSIIHREITSFRGGQKLGYSELTGREKCAYLLDAGIRATAYASTGVRLAARGRGAFSR